MNLLRVNKLVFKFQMHNNHVNEISTMNTNQNLNTLIHDNFVNAIPPLNTDLKFKTSNVKTINELIFYDCIRTNNLNISSSLSPLCGCNRFSMYRNNKKSSFVISIEIQQSFIYIYQKRTREE